MIRDEEDIAGALCTHRSQHHRRPKSDRWRALDWHWMLKTMTPPVHISHILPCSSFSQTFELFFFSGSLMNILFKSPGIFSSPLIIYHLGIKHENAWIYAGETPRADKRFTFYFLLSTNKIAALRMLQFSCWKSFGKVYVMWNSYE